MTELVYLGEANFGGLSPEQEGSAFLIIRLLTFLLTEDEGFSPELVYLGEANLSMKGEAFRLKKILKILTLDV